MKITVLFPHNVHEMLEELAQQRNETVSEVIQFCLGFAHFVNEDHFAHTFNKGPKDELEADHQEEIEIDSISFEICKSFMDKMHSHEDCKHVYSFEEEAKTVIVVACISYVNWRNEGYEKETIND